jgi:hypothetical protein
MKKKKKQEADAPQFPRNGEVTERVYDSDDATKANSPSYLHRGEKAAGSFTGVTIPWASAPFQGAGSAIS